MIIAGKRDGWDRCRERGLVRLPLVTRLLLLALGLLVLVGCASKDAPKRPSPNSTITHVTTGTRTPTNSTTFRPAPAASVDPLAPGSKPARGEVEKKCPYILSGQDEGPVSVADIEGDRVYRTTVLTKDRPVGCRFYFYAPPYEAVADIRATTFDTATAAHNALVRTAQAGSEQISEPNFVPGVDGIRFRTRFFGPDGKRDWAFAFAKAKVLVVVHTQQTNVSLNARLLADAIVKKF